MNEEKSNFKKMEMEVEGMACDACANSIENALEKTPGVKRVEVDLAKNMASVLYDPVRAGFSSFKEAVEEAGYGVKK